MKRLILTFLVAVPFQSQALAQMAVADLEELALVTGRVIANFDFCHQKELAPKIKDRFLSMMWTCAPDATGVSAASKAFQSAYDRRLADYAREGGTCEADFDAWSKQALNILEEAETSCRPQQ